MHGPDVFICRVHFYFCLFHASIYCRAVPDPLSSPAGAPGWPSAPHPSSPAPPPLTAYFTVMLVCLFQSVRFFCEQLYIVVIVAKRSISTASGNLWWYSKPCLIPVSRQTALHRCRSSASRSDLRQKTVSALLHYAGRHAVPSALRLLYCLSVNSGIRSFVSYLNLLLHQNLSYFILSPLIQL